MVDGERERQREIGREGGRKENLMETPNKNRVGQDLLGGDATYR